ncbi:MAG: hypothetical protein V4621_03065 [Pseudomonadota bacterium]
MHNSNNNMLLIIAVALIGILAVMAMNYYNDRNEPASVVEKISNDVSEFGEEVRDEIDDHTTSN